MASVLGSKMRLFGSLLSTVRQKSINFLKHERNLSTQAPLHDLDYHTKNYEIQVPGGTLAGKLWELKSSKQSSDDVPPIICLHGWLDNAGTFDCILPMMMTPSTKYFCLDFPGHGLTTYCPKWWNDAHAEGVISVQRIAKHFGWEKFSIFGHSMGGIVGFLYAAYFPDHVHRLVAMENVRPLPMPPFIDNHIDMMRFAFHMVSNVEEKLTRGKKQFTFAEMLEKMSIARQGALSQEGCLALLKRGLRETGKDQYESTYNLRTHIPGQEGRTHPKMSLQLANEVTSPMCFIKANPGNVYETPEEREEFVSVFRNNLGDNFEYHEVPGSHFLHLNEPQLVAPIALKFLTK